MATLRQDLGPVTAYAYAVSEGYTGTEEEYAELMASYATVAEAAAGSASDAADSASDAEAYGAGTRGGSAVESGDEAYHNNAKYYAESAADDASTVASAVNSFVNITVPAAVQSVTDEGTTQIGLVQGEGTTQIGLVSGEGTTQVGAVAAKGAEVLESIPEDYTELSDDVSDLKSALNTDKGDIINLANYVGTKYTYNGSIEHSTSVQNTNEIPVKILSGDSLSLSITDTTNNNVVFSYYVRYENAESLTYLGEVTTGGAAKTFTAANNIVSFAFYKTGLTAGTLSMHVEAQNPSSTAKDLEEKSAFVPRLAETTNSILENAKGNLVLNEYPGFIAASGAIDPPSTTNLEKYTDYIKCEGKISINLTYTAPHEMYLVYAKYDQSKTFVRRYYIVSGDSKTSYSGELDLDALDAAYIRLAYRSYGSSIVIGRELDLGDIATTHTSVTVKTVAHRGDDVIAPQCTAPSYIIAKKRGINVFENDVNITDDGDLVMWHDSNLTNLWDMVDINGYLMYTDGTDYYWVHPDTNNVYTYENDEYTASAVSLASLTRCRGNRYSINSLGSYTGLSLDILKRIDFGVWKNTRFAGTQILTFAEWVLLCKKLGGDIYIDRKATYTNEIISTMAGIVRKYGMGEHATWLGLTVDQINYLRQIIPGARCGTNNHPTSALIELFAPVNTGKGFFFNCDGNSMSESAIQLGLNAGFEVEVWYVDYGTATAEQVFTVLRNAVSYGVTGITTDHYRVDEAFNYLFDQYHVGN